MTNHNRTDNPHHVLYILLKIGWLDCSNNNKNQSPRIPASGNKSK